MKKIILLLIVFFNKTVWYVFGFLPEWTTDSRSYTKEKGDFLGEVWNEPIRQWAWWIWENVEWIAEKDSDYQGWFLNYVSDIINYILAIAAFVALIYLLYHGFLVITAAGNEDKYKKWLWWLKYWTIALVGIWVSRFIISLIFFVVDYAT